MLINFAGAQGHEKAIGARNELGRRMTPKQLAKVQALAREWKPKGK